MKISDLVKEFDEIKSESFSKLSPKMKDAVKELLQTVEENERDDSLLEKVEKAIIIVSEKYNIAEIQIREFIDKITSENMEK
tara:strand:- start:225 stop:470 length:246 start_codon:yes stop_codon:yes gene_type:complete